MWKYMWKYVKENKKYIKPVSVCVVVVGLEGFCFCSNISLNLKKVKKERTIKAILKGFFKTNEYYNIKLREYQEKVFHWYFIYY